MTRAARLKAFAKLNLGLRVLYKRPDGYHELRTVFQTISLADRMEIAFNPARATAIRIEGAQIPDNIVATAAAHILEALRIHADIQFRLQKNIPSGAGLGGGSSDAAAVLLALPVLAGKRLTMDRLLTIAGQLGSDVPFFLYGGTALGIGRGEELYPMPSGPRASVVLVAPPVHSSTAEAYGDLSRSLRIEESLAKSASFQQAAWLHSTSGIAYINDFEAGVFARHPELRVIRDRLRRLGATSASMTGSGSSVFGVFADRARQAKALQAFPGAQTYAVSFLSRSQYRAAWNRALTPHTKGDEWPPRSLYAR